ncbi:hypothetical protein JYB87_16420 [Shewanella avicenniae]|uniref:Uncharacterized protein n=1 Tax=Shewanella avicenniae TaxID=2814294 RepID=A0ABX7QPT7_9GAMM|nr:hypothetical protein [Shewanella avicenniae]QSX33289.1 hypothetical protein JYB87_16420 [Shewanella avicenniae]
MIGQHAVFDAVRRGYHELELASNGEIMAYFNDIEPDVMVGHVSNIKGILFEQEVVKALNEQGMDAILFEATNHPILDIALMDDDEIAAEVQLKATDSVSYINETLAENPDTAIIVTSEVADHLDSAMVIDSGLDNEALTEAVVNALSDTAIHSIGDDMISDAVSDGLADVVGESLLPIPITPIGIIAALLGIPFL